MVEKRILDKKGLQKDTRYYMHMYYENHVLPKYPDLTYQQVNEICRSMFRLVKSQMESGELKTIRVKYFGSFQIFKGRAKGVRNKMIKAFLKGTITPDFMKIMDETARKYLKEKYNEEIPPYQFPEGTVFPERRD